MPVVIPEKRGARHGVRECRIALVVHGVETPDFGGVVSSHPILTDMIELVRQSYARQFEAVLSKLHNTILLCPSDQWDQPVGNYPFWQVVYHTLFYLDLYLSRSETAFTPQSFHRTDYEHFGFNADGQPCTADVPYKKDTLVSYVRHCRRKIEEIISTETEESLAGPSGFWWYKIPRAEFHLNNIRHVQHHSAQLSLHLRRTAGIQLNWVSSGWKEQSES